uniref:ATP synthase F0 subunit 8 n=1 Tax=Clione limacina TaxID=71516 RepID=A0A6M8NQ36_CLILI|nr:ATP synthase F0 subunit 8 [Clione limacina]
MPQMMPLPWIMVFLASVALLWAIMTMVFFLYQPRSVSSAKGFSDRTVYLNWKW